ncbi:MAG: molybdopterin guanine dinucleotide-containing S/N-oxide reductase [Hyphomicrobiales bacterium]
MTESIRYSVSHWGVYEVEPAGNEIPRLRPFSRDPDPSPIGLDQLEEQVTRLRVRRPAVRRSWLEGGPGTAPELRGKEPFVEVSWALALDLVAKEIERVRGKFGNASIFGGSYGWSSAGRFHHAQSQLHRFLNSVGGYVRHVDTYSLGAGAVIMPHVLGCSMAELIAMHTSWDVLAEHAKLFVAFGGVPLKNSRVSPGGAGIHRVRAALRGLRDAGMRFINIGPLRDGFETGGEVEWIQIRPNTDTALMLALAHVLLTEGRADADFLRRCCTGADIFTDYLLGKTDGQPKSPAWAAAITGVEAARIVTLARDMAGTRTMLNAAWALQRAVHGEQPFWALVALASMLGQIGLPGGGFGLGYGVMNGIGSAHADLKGPTLPQGRNKVSAFIPVARIADMLLRPGTPFTYNGATHVYPHIRLVYWAGGNPFHHHQDLNRLSRAWQMPDSIVVHEQYWTPTAKLADVVLPASISAERNDLGFASREDHLIAMRQITQPIGQSRCDFDIFADLAERLGATAAYTEGLSEQGWLLRLYGEFAGKARELGITLPSFQEFWELGFLDLMSKGRPGVMLEKFRHDPAGHKLGTPSGRIELFSQRVAGFGLADCPGHPTWLEPPERLGAARAEAFPLHLTSDQPVRRLHSQLDHAAYSVAGKRADREVVEINPVDAGRRGISDGAVVELFNDRGRCLAGARVTDNVMPGVLRLSTGAWYDPAGSEGLDKHGNPNVLTLDRGSSGLSQGCSAHTCLVEAAAFAGSPPAVTAHNLPPFYGEGPPGEAEA